MFYTVSKVAWFFATPSNLFLSLVTAGAVLGLFTSTRRVGLGLATLAATLTLAAGLTPLSSLILLPLEERFPPPGDHQAPVAGIILLGGAVEADDSRDVGQVVTNEAGDRVLETIALASRYPDAKILISGGGGTVFADGTAEAPIIAAYFARIGIDRGRLVVEDRSRTTAENAAYSRALVTPKAGERWLLVTSAWHMPRAVGTFRKAGFPVLAYPVDYRTGGPQQVLRFFAFASEGLRRLDIGVKEWAGLLAYRLAGRTSELFPAPEPPAAEARAALPPQTAR